MGGRREERRKDVREKAVREEGRVRERVSMVVRVRGLVCHATTSNLIYTPGPTSLALPFSTLYPSLYLDPPFLRV